jgi:hypothetical protein
MVHATILLSVTSAQEPPTYDSAGGGTIAFSGRVIKKVDGPGNWVITGMGQDLTIQEKKDGDGNLTLKGFGRITIKEKNGRGHLVVEANNGEFLITDIMNGDGHAYLRNPGRKTITKKDGKGNVYYRGDQPTFPGGKKGDGTAIPEAGR